MGILSRKRRKIFKKTGKIIKVLESLHRQKANYLYITYNFKSLYIHFKIRIDI